MKARSPLLWLIPGSVLLTLGAAVWTLGTARSERDRAIIGDGHNVASYGFNLVNLTVPRNLLVASGLPRDGVEALDGPRMVSAAQLDGLKAGRHGKLLVPDDRVVGLEIDGDARAYPLRFLQWHEIVNDTVGSEPVAVTYSPLCDSVVVASREIGGATARFGHSGLLYESNLVMYDRTGAVPGLWSQLMARAISGREAGAELKLLPFSLTTWSAWRHLHPATRVMAPQPQLAREYKRDPYSSYFGSDILRFPVSPKPPSHRLHLKDRVVVATAGGHTEAFALPDLARDARAESGTVEREIGDVPVRITFDNVLGTASVASLDPQHPVQSVRTSFWFAWYASGPGSR
ncbi:MAG: DUF3179 domain-containing protein [Acidobacteria bacterium]|nr:DUF3179 domain-containing protein [Acidobacteriota bacterium]